MDTKLVYHVVIDKPMRLGQHILTKINLFLIRKIAHR